MLLTVLEQLLLSSQGREGDGLVEELLEVEAVLCQEVDRRGLDKKSQSLNFIMVPKKACRCR
jgi:hypothetical protein